MANMKTSKVGGPGPVMVDVEGHTLTNEEVQRIQNPLVGGVILFARNFASRQQLTDLCAAISSVREQPLLIATDHEGGRVQRFRTDGFTHMPSMQSLGQIWDNQPELAMRLATDTGFIIASELRACGVDLSFTPVLDLNYGVSSVIGNRSFHSSAKAVTQLARALTHGLALGGMASCGKHFPGHGAVEADSHLEVPIDNRSLDEIMQSDAMPYEWLGDLVVSSVMPAHVIYPKVDNQPAGFSKIWIQKILRERLNYKGVVFSDDLTMEGATVAGDIHDRALAALTAGCDMALVCNRPDLADDLLTRLQWKSSEESSKRINSLKPKSTGLCWHDMQNSINYQNAKQRLQSEKLLG